MFVSNYWGCVGLFWHLGSTMEEPGQLRQVVEKLKEQKKVLQDKENAIVTRENVMGEKEKKMQQLVYSFREKQKTLEEKELSLNNQQQQLQQHQQQLQQHQQRLQQKEQQLQQHEQQEQKQQEKGKEKEAEDQDQQSKLAPEEEKRLKQFGDLIAHLEAEHEEIVSKAHKRIFELEEALKRSQEKEMTVVDLEARLAVTERKLAEQNQPKEESDVRENDDEFYQKRVTELEGELSECHKEMRKAELTIEQTTQDYTFVHLEIEELIGNNTDLNEKLLVQEVLLKDKAKEIEKLKLSLQSNVGNLSSPQQKDDSPPQQSPLRQQDQEQAQNSPQPQKLMTSFSGDEGKEPAVGGFTSSDDNRNYGTPVVTAGSEMRMRWAYTAGDGLFSVQKGEGVLLLDVGDEEWYLVKTILGEEEGYVPANYLRKKVVKQKRKQKEVIAEVAAGWKANDKEEGGSRVDMSKMEKKPGSRINIRGFQLSKK